MNDNYILMHKHDPCGVVAIDRDSGALTDFAATYKKHLPFLGNADLSLMKIWWNHRAVPGTRRDIADIMRMAGCSSNMQYLAKNLALSVTDTYWICPADVELSWDEVSLYRAAEDEGGIIPYNNGTSFDPNASLGGQMDKYWDLSMGTPLLVKKAYENYGQQSINELFATELHERQSAVIPFVRYQQMCSDDNGVLACCDAFTSEKIEFVSAYEVLRSRKLKNNVSDFDQYIDICVENGLERKVMQDFMDYMLLSDFAITNVDEHLQNFGILRDSDTMKLLGPAPIFDSGNSMFFNNNGKTPLSREEILLKKINSLHTSEEKMLKHIGNRKILKTELLPTRAEVKDFYESYGVPEERAEFIAGSYDNKMSMLKEFQKGISISLYHEREKR